ncbi:MAG TPA: SRPBCC family protein [Candidatus Binatia bacterium]|nr:SRPBCC family protein [Candidatus Binatia bacterium]
MALRIEKTFQVSQPIEKVWGLLSDLAKVASCVPGAQITEKIDVKTYKGSIRVKVGPSLTDYKGEVQILRLDTQNHEIEIQGKGQDVRGRGSASMTMTGKLVALNEGGTEVTSISEVNVVGILAQMGSRVITEVSNIMFDKFSRNFQDLLQQSADPPPVANATTVDTAAPSPRNHPPAPIEGGSIAWQAIKQMFRSWLRALKSLFLGQGA